MPESLKDVASEKNVEADLIGRIEQLERQLQQEAIAEQELTDKVKMEIAKQEYELKLRPPEIKPQVDVVEIIEDGEAENRDVVYNLRPNKPVNKNNIRVGMGY